MEFRVQIANIEWQQLHDVAQMAEDLGFHSLTNQFTDASFKEKVRFVREEAARHGRDPKAIKISHVVCSPILTDSAAAGQQMAENMAGMMGVSPDAIRRSPIFLVGTSEEYVTELKRRAREWELSEIVFSWSLGDAGLRKVAQEILPDL